MTAPDTAFETALNHFPDNVRSDLRSHLAKGSVIPAEQVARYLDAMTIDIGHLMVMLLPVAAAYARVPISDFKVGAVALGMPPGNLYLGANMEFRHEALSFCVHGEQSATNNAWLHGETGLQALAINAAPCGYCRQFLYELTTATQDFNILLKANQDHGDYAYTLRPLTDYLPDAFGPGDLGVKGGLMEPEAHGLILGGGGATAMAALDAANTSYSPYTSDYCGAGLCDNNGTVYTGRYAENAAYNPSLSPLESALAFMNMRLPAQHPLTISEAVLVEAPAKISQKGVTEAVLSSVAPSLSLTYLAAS